MPTIQPIGAGTPSCRVARQGTRRPRRKRRRRNSGPRCPVKNHQADTRQRVNRAEADSGGDERKRIHVELRPILIGWALRRMLERFPCGRSYSRVLSGVSGHNSAPTFQPPTLKTRCAHSFGWQGRLTSPVRAGLVCSIHEHSICSIDEHSILSIDEQSIISDRSPRPFPFFFSLRPMICIPRCCALELQCATS